MRNVFIYHRPSDRYLGINADSLPLWGESEIITVSGDAFDKNKDRCLWKYSDRENTGYAGYSSQGFHHYLSGATLGISGTGEEPGIAVGINNKLTCRDLLQTVFQINENEHHVIWSRAGFYLSLTDDNVTVKWAPYSDTPHCCFELLPVVQDCV